MDSAKGLVAGANLDEVGARAAETASNLYRGGRELLAGNEDLSQAADNLSAAVRKNPLAAVGIAFSAGLAARPPRSRLGRMRNDIVALAQQYAQQQAQAAVRRVASPPRSASSPRSSFVIVVIALFAALFFWLTSLYGPISAALVVAAVALVLGLIALLPLVVKRRPAPPPPAPNPAPVRVAVGADRAIARVEAASIDSGPPGGCARDDGARFVGQ